LRKILIVLGIVMIAASCITFFVGANLATNNLSQLSQSKADPATFCRSGEKLATAEPRGTGSGTIGLLFCVDDAGQRRDITTDVMENAFGQMFTVLPGWATTSFTAIALFCIGLPILIVGAILSLRGSRKPTPLMPSEGFSGNPPATLKDQLKQLDDARNAGLISDTEYERKRQQILDQVS